MGTDSAPPPPSANVPRIVRSGIAVSGFGRDSGFSSLADGQGRRDDAMTRRRGGQDARRQEIPPLFREAHRCTVARRPVSLSSRRPSARPCLCTVGADRRAARYSFIRTFTLKNRYPAALRSGEGAESVTMSSFALKSRRLKRIARRSRLQRRRRGQRPHPPTAFAPSSPPASATRTARSRRSASEKGGDGHGVALAAERKDLVARVEDDGGHVWRELAAKPV